MAANGREVLRKIATTMMTMTEMMTGNT